MRARSQANSVRMGGLANGERAEEVILGRMRKRRWKCAVMAMLCLCTALAGCAQNYAWHRCNGAEQYGAEEAARRAKSSAQPMPDTAGAVRPAGYEATQTAPPRILPPPPPENVVKVVADVPEVVPPPQGAPTAGAAVQVPPQQVQLPSQQAARPPGVPAPAAVAGSNPQAPPAGGKPITIHLDDADVRKALEILGRQANLSILVSSGVNGRVTLDLRDKTADEILQAIARLCRLTVRREQDVIYITAVEETKKQEAENLPVRVYHLNYVKSSDVKKMIEKLLSKSGTSTCSPDAKSGIQQIDTGVAPSSGGGGGGGGGSGSGGGGGEDATGGNSMAGGEIIIVQDYEQVLKTVDRVIAQIDVQPIQVLIEAVIVQVNLKKGMDLGVNFALLDGAGKALAVMGDGAAINAAAGFTPASVLAAGGQLASGYAPSPATNGLKFGFVSNSTTGFISALETMGETKVLACPRLLVLNKQHAELHLGQNLGYQTSTVSQTSTTENVQFLSIGTQLRLRPFVSSDGMVRMEIHPERSTGSLDASGIPQTDVTQVTSNILIPDGATIVIGGLFDNQLDENWSGLPLLSRLPWIGILFRHTTTATTRTELIVILTPHIWRPECPQGLNYLGPPRSLGLERRVMQAPLGTGKDPPSLYETPPPDAIAVPASPPPEQ